MKFRENKPIERPEVEKKFSLKNPEDKAILISMGIVLSVVILILVLIIIFGGFLDINDNVNSSSF